MSSWLPCHLLGVGLCLLVTTCVGVSDTTASGTVPQVNCTTYVDTPGGRLCLWLVTDPKSWTEADADCASHGGYLLTVTSPEINEVVTGIMQKNSIINLWLGLREESSAWKWWFNQKWLFHQGCYVYNEDQDTDKDVKFTLNKNSYSACSQTCIDANKQVSALRSPTECACSDVLDTGQARGNCNLLCKNQTDEVCGGYKDGNLASYVNIPTGGYSAWERDQPNNHLGYQACGVMARESNYMWNDVMCTERLGAICELTHSNESCLQNSSFHFHEKWGCYNITDVKMTFFQAIMYCGARGGRLLEIESAEKQAFYVERAKTLFPEPISFFVGLSRVYWVWSTGDLIMYSNWQGARPNGKDQNCTVINSEGKWDDTVCSPPYSYICQRGTMLRKPTTTAPTTTTTTAPTTPSTVPCSEPCEEEFGEDDGINRVVRRNLVKNSLIAGGVLLAIILIGCAIGTIYCIKQHYKKVKENRFDYFFGVDVSREEDQKGFNSARRKENGDTHGTKTPPPIEKPAHNSFENDSTLEKNGVDKVDFTTSNPLTDDSTEDFFVVDPEIAAAATEGLSHVDGVSDISTTLADDDLTLGSLGVVNPNTDRYVLPINMPNGHVQSENMP